jgi:hypothetical protein
MPQALTDATIHRLSPALGAEVVGIDLGQPFDAATLNTPVVAVPSALPTAANASKAWPAR